MAATAQVVALLSKGDFEFGTMPWTQVGSFPRIVDSGSLPVGVSPDSGSDAAWLGGHATVEDQLYQQVPSLPRFRP